MFTPGKKTILITSMFIASSIICGCADESLGEQQLKDDNGDVYSLINNGDGTETAKYEDGREVTFKRDEDGNLNFISGAAGLLGGLAAGYFLFHGFNSPKGSFNSSTGRYTVSEPLNRINNDERRRRMNTYVPSNSRLNSTENYNKVNKDDKSSGGSTAKSSSSKSSSSSSNSSSSSKSEAKSSSSSSKNSNSTVSGTKSGFGSAGARSAAS